ncbi:MAG: hypothetical protein GWO24_05070 [Akkermansiaceae bacterium]|nr:hypothetical protein [Akkermansiaceae bacterium]
MSQNHPCPEFEELERLLAGALAGESRREMGVHVENCPTCAGRLADVSENLEALEGIALVLREQESAAGAVPPQKIGSFTIIRELARGGMGVVYLAEQKHPPAARWPSRCCGQALVPARRCAVSKWRRSSWPDCGTPASRRSTRRA